MRKLTHLNHFSARRNFISAVWDISTGNKPSTDLNQLSHELDSISAEMSSAHAAGSYAALAGLTRIVSVLVQWRNAVLDGQVESDRFLRAGKERYSLWFEEYRDQPCARSLLAVVSFVSDICTIAEVLKLGGALAVVPLPLGIFEVEGMRIPKRPEDMPAEPEPTSESVDLTVAFLKFQINGQPAVELQNLSPGEVHDLEIEVRVSRWPVEQSELCLTPISVEPKSTYDFPTFSFDKPVGLPPYVLRQRGRAIVILPQGMHARPFEFKYMAEFLPARREQPVAVVGHRTLFDRRF